jgi:hypothetical protein
MLEFLRSLRDATDDATATLRWFLGVVVVLGGIGLALGKWLGTLNTIQVWSFWIGVVGVVLFLATLIVDYINRRAIERIPDLMERMNKLVLDYIDGYSSQLDREQWFKLLNDYGVLLNVDFHRLKSALLNENQTYDDATRGKIVDEEFERISKAYDRKLRPGKKLTDTLTDLRDMGGILNTYNAGLSRCTETPQYRRLNNRIRALQRRLPSAVVSAKVNDFYFQSEGFYYMLLGVMPLGGHPSIPGTKMPVKAAARIRQIRPIVDGQLATLIASVRESINAYRDRNKEQTESKK